VTITTTSTNTITAGIYCRISDDRAGAGLGVMRQGEDGRAYCATRGWEVGDLYIDNDISAYSGRRRPEYERLLLDLAAGEINAVVAWHPDRLHRSPVELEAFIVLIEAAGAKVGTVRAGEYDLSNPTGRMSARIVGAVAKHESEHKAERIRRKIEELAAAGEGRGGGTRPFGFDADRLTVNEPEAVLVREAALRVLAGETVRGLCTEWTARGVSTVTGKPWNPHVLKSMLISGRIAGLREHHGEVVAKAMWPAIITDVDHRRLRAILTDPSRRKNLGNARSYLLSGFVHCGQCGARMVARPRDDGRRRYVCAKGPGFSGCGGAYILADVLEEHVAAMVLEALDGPALAEAMRAKRDDDATDEATAAIVAAEAKLQELAEMWAADELSRAEWLVARNPVEARLEAAKRSLSRTRGTTALDGFVGGTEPLQVAWESRNFDQRRAIIAAVVDRVNIGPGRRGYNRFDPERVDVVWRA